MVVPSQARPRIFTTPVIPLTYVDSADVKSSMVCHVAALENESTCEKYAVEPSQTIPETIRRPDEIADPMRVQAPVFKLMEYNPELYVGCVPVAPIPYIVVPFHIISWGAEMPVGPMRVHIPVSRSTEYISSLSSSSPYILVPSHTILPGFEIPVLPSPDPPTKVIAPVDLSTVYILSLRPSDIYIIPVGVVDWKNSLLVSSSPLVRSSLVVTLVVPKLTQFAGRSVILPEVIQLVIGSVALMIFTS